MFGEFGQIDCFACGEDIVEGERGARARNLIDRAVGGDGGACRLERVHTLNEADTGTVGGYIINLVDRYPVDSFARNVYRDTRGPVIGIPTRGRDIEHNSMLRMSRYKVRHCLIQLKPQPAAAGKSNRQHTNKDDYNMLPRLYPKRRGSR